MSIRRNLVRHEYAGSFVMKEKIARSVTSEVMEPIGLDG